jgi:hypothetical protein
MNLTVLKCDTEGRLVDSQGNPVKTKLDVARNLGRLEQIFACAARVLTRHEEHDLPQEGQVEIKKA